MLVCRMLGMTDLAHVTLAVVVLALFGSGMLSERRTSN